MPKQVLKVQKVWQYSATAFSPSGHFSAIFGQKYENSGPMWRVKMDSKSKNSFFPDLIYWNHNRIHLGTFKKLIFGPMVPPLSEINKTTVMEHAVSPHLRNRPATTISIYLERRYFCTKIENEKKLIFISRSMICVWTYRNKIFCWRYFFGVWDGNTGNPFR